MDNISKEEFNTAEKVKSKKKNNGKPNENLGELLAQMDNPVLAQKRLAVQIKVSLDKRIKEEMKSKGYLSEITRKWVDTYNSILEKIQKGLHGDKSVNLNLHGVVSHSDIAAKIREAHK